MIAGSRIGPFELREIIGRGGMGEVWRAHDTRLQRDVALKTLPARFAADERRTARLTREAHLLATLNHPNIAGILGLEEQDGVGWLVLELVEGPTLDDRLADGSVELPEVLSIALQLADAMQAAHARGIVHCDLKSANIKLTDERRVKVLDFGISQSFTSSAFAESDDPTLTAAPVPEEFAGTLAYMSPEQIRREPVAPTADIWAFGVLLYRLLAERLPFPGPTVADTIAQVLKSPPDLSALRPGTPEALVRLVRRCLEKDPRQRIQQAGELRVLLEEVMSANEGGMIRLSEARSRAWVKRAVAAGLVVLGAGGLVWFQGQPPRAPVLQAQPARADTSIAVLPFVNMSADPEQEYFSDGLSEELISQLAHIEGLRVTARTSAFSFKGRAQDLRAVGQALGVSHLLEGSVRKVDGKVRITAQLIDAAIGYHLWSETFDRTVGDVLAIQDEIATAVAQRLGPSLGVVPSTADYGGTRSAEAYDHLLRGLAVFTGFSRDAMLAAIEEYRAALAVDPGYARAAAELAIAMGAASAAGASFSDRERDEATALANRLAPDAPLTHVANMWLHSDRHEWRAADDSCKAVFRSGNDPRAKWICAGYLTMTGRVRAAMPYREAARGDDPLSVVVASTLIRQYVILGMPSEMQRELHRAEALPGWRGQAAVEVLADLAHARASPAEMRAQLAVACPILGKASCDAWTVAVSDPQRAPTHLRSQLRAVGHSSPNDAGTIALASAYLGDTTLALDALELFTARARSPTFQTLWFPLLGEVRKDARFERLMHELGFVELWRQSNQWADFCQPRGADDVDCS